MSGGLRKDIWFIAFLLVMLLGFLIGYSISVGANSVDLSENSLPLKKTNANNVQRTSNVQIDDYQASPAEEASQVLNNIVPEEFQDILLDTNCTFIFRKMYKLCGHLVDEEVNVYKLYEGLKYPDILAKFQGWQILSFDKNNVMLYKEFSGECPEHYIVKLEDGVVKVFYANPEGGNNLKEITSISENNLKYEDRERLKAGIRIDTDQELASFIEDFGS